MALPIISCEIKEDFLYYEWNINIDQAKRKTELSFYRKLNYKIMCKEAIKEILSRNMKGEK